MTKPTKLGFKQQDYSAFFPFLATKSSCLRYKNQRKSACKSPEDSYNLLSADPRIKLLTKKASKRFLYPEFHELERYMIQTQRYRAKMSYPTGLYTEPEMKSRRQDTKHACTKKKFM